jgi:hypothetical protein
MVNTPLTSVNFASEDVASTFSGEDKSNTFPVLMWVLKKSPCKRCKSGNWSRAYFVGGDEVRSKGEAVGVIRVKVW